ncbi:MAG: Rieske 2Fe-2S domain-containing protein [Chloroflexi bacterium]|nr:Rieske 2Fe-2S domain-containing protein [Chloroflexota bacterium]
MAQMSRELGLFVPPEKVAELGERQEVEQEQQRKVRRRLAFRWVGWGAILALLGQWGVGFALGFFWPQKVGAFGGVVTAGAVADFKVGDVKVIREGKFYLTRVPEGFMALWWKCPHLGCTVPWKEADVVMGGPPGEGDKPFASSGRFNCPCHGSIYNRYGQILQGPAPRPMDRFPVTIQGGKIMVDTGPSKAISRPVASASDAVPA